MLPARGLRHRRAPSVPAPSPPGAEPQVRPGVRRPPRACTPPSLSGRMKRGRGGADGSLPLHHAGFDLDLSHARIGHGPSGDAGRRGGEQGQLSRERAREGGCVGVAAAAPRACARPGAGLAPQPDARGGGRGSRKASSSRLPSASRLHSVPASQNRPCLTWTALLFVLEQPSF